MKQFDLEQNIMNCWNICEDLKAVCEAVMEDELTKDGICNILLGMAELYHVKFDKTFKSFEEMLKENHENKKVVL